LPEIAGRLWRHALAVLAVLFVAAGVAYSFKHTAPTYQESASIIFLPPISGAKPNPFSAVGGSLTEAAGAVVADFMSPQGLDRVRQAGGTADVDVELLNSYNLEYPNYSSPYLTVTTSSQDFGAVHQTFKLVTKLLIDRFNARQVQYSVAANNQIYPDLIGDTGPLEGQGSSKRALVGLAILTIVAVFAVTSFLDRHPIRLSRLLNRGAAGPGRPQWPLPRLRRPGIREAGS